jgi:hypothetical protein
MKIAANRNKAKVPINAFLGCSGSPGGQIIKVIALKIMVEID